MEPEITEDAVNGALLIQSGYDSGEHGLSNGFPPYALASIRLVFWLIFLWKNYSSGTAPDSNRIPHLFPDGSRRRLNGDSFFMNRR